jgi:hypothetical protein
MDGEFANHGVRFKHPPDWEVTEQAKPGEMSITVSSPRTAFWTLTMFYDRPEPQEIIDTVLAAFHEEYDEMDDYPARARLCNHKTIARDIEFVCLELLNSAWARCFSTEDYTVLVLYQTNDLDLEETLPVMEAITKSLTCEAKLNRGSVDESEQSAWTFEDFEDE